MKFFAYKDTMQEVCLRLMGKKLLVALTMEGKFAGEGLQSIDEDDDMLPQVPLFVEHVVAQPRIDLEGGGQGFAQRGGGGVDLRRLGETLQLRRERDVGHVRIANAAWPMAAPWRGHRCHCRRRPG